MKKTDSYSKGVLAAITVYTIWGFTFLASSLAQRTASPMVLLMYRFDIASLLMLLPVIFGRKKLKLKGRKLRSPLLMGLCEPCVYFLGEQYGLKNTNSSISGIFISIIPLVSMALTAVVLGEKPGKKQWLFAAVSIMGIIAISVFSSGAGGSITAKGVLWLLVAILTAGFYTLLNRISSRENFGVYERTILMQLEGAVFFTAGSVLTNAGHLSALLSPLSEPSFMLSIIYLSVFASVLGYLLHNYALDHAPVANVSTLCGLVTIISVLAGVVILDEPFSFRCAVAMVVVLIGIRGVQKYTPGENIKE